MELGMVYLLTFLVLLILHFPVSLHQILAEKVIWDIYYVQVGQKCTYQVYCFISSKRWGSLFKYHLYQHLKLFILWCVQHVFIKHLEYWFLSFLLKTPCFDSNCPKLILSCEISWLGLKLCACQVQLWHQALLEHSSDLFWAFRWPNILFSDEYRLLVAVKFEQKQIGWVLHCVVKVS